MKYPKRVFIKIKYIFDNHKKKYDISWDDHQLRIHILDLKLSEYQYYDIYLYQNSSVGRESGKSTTARIFETRN